MISAFFLNNLKGILQFSGHRIEPMENSVLLLLLKRHQITLLQVMTK
jgi:hypothetical protein